jgi:hypothetical protein
LTTETLRTARPAERRVSDHRDSRLGTPLDDSPAKSAIVEDAERDLNRRNRGELERLVQLIAVHIRHPDPLDKALVD